MFDIFFPLFAVFGVDDAIYIVAALAALAGAGTSYYGARKSQQEMEQAAGAEIKRQKRYQQEATAAQQQSFQQSTPFVGEQQIEAGRQAALENYSRLNALPLSGAQAPFGQTEGSRVVTEGQNRLSNAARASLTGYNQWQLDQAIKNIRAQQALGIIGSNANQSTTLLPLELQSAQQAGAGTQALGGLISSLGGLAGSYAAMQQPTTQLAGAGNLRSPWNARAWRHRYGN